MPEGVSNLFWDSCVFYAFLDQGTTHDISGIEQYLHEARNGKHRIYVASLVLAEVVPSAITKPDIGTFQDFIEDLQGAVVLMNPSPDVMHQAALLKDLPYRKAKASKVRRLSTTDAIILASCLEVRDIFRTKIDAFHTFDDGKKRDPVDGKMVPLISYQDWCDGFTPEQKATAAPVISLNRRKPDHPSPTLTLHRPTIKY
jgi:predicted nucleic acid-binding protein